MSSHADPRPAKRTLADLRRAKLAREPLTMVTAYDFHAARIADEAGVDLILVGDSAANVVLGHGSTNAVTMDEMLVFTGAVARGASRAIVVGDMPFMSFQTDDVTAVRNAGRFVAEAHADAVKIEGGGTAIDRVRAITAAGIPVFGHLGLTPQSSTMQGGYRAQARTASPALHLLDESLELQAAGAVCVVLEAIPPQVAAAVTEALDVPTIGIGAGAQTDGQVLVWHDLLGIAPGPHPRFVRTFGEVGSATREALDAYVAAVHAREFPAQEHLYTMPDEELAAFRAGMAERTRHR